MTTIEERSSRHVPPSVKAILRDGDDQAIGEFLQQGIVQETSYVALLVSTSHQALEAVHHIKPNLLILDYHLRDCTGIALYDQLRSFDGLASVPALILTASFEKHQQEIEHHHLIGLGKPLDLDELLQTIEILLQRA